jgi:hypothetical protein
MAIPVTNRPPAVPKGVVWFGILLTLSLALLGLLASYLVTSLNGDYQEIVSRQLPALAIVRNLSQANATGRRLVETLPNKLDENTLREIRAKLNSIREENTARLERLHVLLDDHDGQDLMAALMAKRQKYRETTLMFLEELSRGVSAEQRAVWRIRISEVDSQYVDAQDDLADYCSSTAEKRGDALTHRSRRLSELFLIIAAWPLLLAVGSFLSGLISTLVFFFRHRN